MAFNPSLYTSGTMSTSAKKMASFHGILKWGSPKKQPMADWTAIQSDVGMYPVVNIINPASCPDVRCWVAGQTVTTVGNDMKLEMSMTRRSGMSGIHYGIPVYLFFRITLDLSVFHSDSGAHDSTA